MPHKASRLRAKHACMQIFFFFFSLSVLVGLARENFNQTTIRKCESESDKLQGPRIRRGPKTPTLRSRATGVGVPRLSIRAGDKSNWYQVTKLRLFAWIATTSDARLYRRGWLIAIGSPVCTFSKKETKSSVPRNHGIALTDSKWNQGLSIEC